jgi:allantoin racemase
MRIWWQSSMALGSNPIWNPYEAAMKRHFSNIARPGTQVDVHGVKYVEPILGRSAYARYLNEAQVIDNALQAQREGYDAFCAGCTLDPGIREIKEVVDIPVAFLFESCIHLASILGGTFALLGFNREVLRHHEDLVRHYDLGGRLVPSDTPLNMATPDLVAGLKDPGAILTAVKEVAGKAIEKGVGTFISTCNILNMVLVTSGCGQIDGVPILDTAGALLKMTELMVDLEQIGIRRSRKGYYSCLANEDVLRMRRSYGVD